MNEFDFVLRHRPGSLHVKPDALSRRPDYVVDSEPSNFLRLLQPQHLSSTSTSLPYALWHRRFGHLGHRTLTRTLKTFDLPFSPRSPSATLCSPCALGKSTRANIPPHGSRAHNLLEVIEADSQGPFPILAHDGSNRNIKFIDSYSGYLKMETLPDASASSALDAFRRFQSRLERRCGRLIQHIATDQGTEFMGEFIEHLSRSGITKRKGFAYRHTHPGKAERAHQSVLHQARAMLIDSNLPAMFYADAQLAAAYLHNRFIHAGQTKTPFELMFGYPPSISHLRPFGCVAYAHVPEELRSKLDPSAVRCRLLGYLDDDDTEELMGYKLLRESDLAIIHSRDVQFDEITFPTPLPDILLYDDSVHGEDLFGDPTYFPDADTSSDTDSSSTCSDYDTPSLNILKRGSSHTLGL